MSSPSKGHYSLHHHRNACHLKWSRSNPPVLTVPSGAKITLELPDGGGNQITRQNAAAGTALSSFDLSQADPGLGPIYIEGAEPGDVLRVDFLAIEPLVDYGWTAVFPGFGILCEDDEFLFPAPSSSSNSSSAPLGKNNEDDDLGNGEKGGRGALKIYDLGTPGQEDWVGNRGYVVFKRVKRGAAAAAATAAASAARKKEKEKDTGEDEMDEEIRIPYRPFIGLVGVAPAEGEHPMVPPLETGGNIDTRRLGVGSSLYLPVQVPGALLSLGDGHVAQGDGEVCGTAIETQLRATVQVTVEKAGGKKKSPWVLTPPTSNSTTVTASATASANAGRLFMCLGMDSDVDAATQKAVRGIMDWLVAEKGLDRTEAYMLVSIAGKLRMFAVPDMPNHAISCAIPLDIFVPVCSCF